MQEDIQCAELIFKSSVMGVLIENDLLLKRMHQDLTKRGNESDFILEVLFNSEVIGDTSLERLYNKIAKNELSQNTCCGGRTCEIPYFDV